MVSIHVVISSLLEFTDLLTDAVVLCHVPSLGTRRRLARQCTRQHPGIPHTGALS